MIRGLKFTKFKGSEHSGYHGHAGRPGSVGGSAPSSSISFESLREEYNAHPGDIPFSKENVRLTAYRVGEAEGKHERGVHFAESRESAEQYAHAHPGAKVIEYNVFLDKALIAGHQNSVCKQFFNISYSDLHDRLHRGTDSAGAMRKLDVKIRKEALKRGFSGIVYTRPAPPAVMEVVAFTEQGISVIEK